MNPSVTFTGEEVQLVAAVIATALPRVEERDYEVMDLLLDKALSALPELAPDVAEMIARLRVPPLERFRRRIVGALRPGVIFDLVDASVVGAVPPSAALIFLERLVVNAAGVVRDGNHWKLTEEKDHVERPPAP